MRGYLENVEDMTDLSVLFCVIERRYGIWV